jgi:hypothetical protein
MKLRSFVPVLCLLGLLQASPAFASLSVFQTFVGNVGVSTDGFGSLSQTGTISASVPAGATVLGAWLYSSSHTFSGSYVPGGTLEGNALTYGGAVVNSDAPFLFSNRANVTAIVKPIIDGGPGGIYDFTVTESHSTQDGTALVVVYELASLPVSTVGILDGFSATGGDSTSISFAGGLDPTAPGFFAEMRLGIGFSCGIEDGCTNQRSNVTVNGTLITSNAGNNDDAVGLAANGNLITVGGFDDPFSPMLPAYGDDHERYDLVPQIDLGDTQILVETDNPTADDNIFLAVFHVTGEGRVTDPDAEVPEPGTLSMLALAGGAFALRRRYQRRGTKV